VVDVRDDTDRRRGQAFTLEGFVAAALLLGAVGLALQAAVAPPESGTQDRPGSLRTQADDILRTTASSDRGLSYAVRYWDPLRQRYYEADDRAVGYGNATLPPSLFDGAFARAFDTRALTYNVVVVYQRPNTTALGQEPLVYRGTPSENAVTARHTTTLYDGMRLTSPATGARTLSEFTTNESNSEGRFFPIPDVSDGPIYNVVEIRVTVW
jgi:hypothetical protein